MQLLKMFTSATTKDFKINLSFISLVLAHPNSVHVNETLGRPKPNPKSNWHHRFSMGFTSTFIGANDSHLVLNMNSVGATTILSSKSKLGWPTSKRLGWSDQVARIRFEYQPGCQTLHKWLSGHKKYPKSYGYNFSKADQTFLNNHWYKDIKATGWFQYFEVFWARHYDNPASLTKNGKRKCHVRKATIMVHKTEYNKEESFV